MSTSDTYSRLVRNPGWIPKHEFEGDPYRYDRNWQEQARADDRWKEAVREAVARYVPRDKRIIMSPFPIHGFDASRVGPQKPAQKPAGLWYACGTEWIELLLAEAKGRIAPYIYVIELDLRSVVTIRDMETLRRFTDVYGVMGFNAGFDGLLIDWPRVVADGYTGIEICPNQPEARYEKRLAWYAGLIMAWEIASGCIWSPEPIMDLRGPIAPVE